MPDHYQWQGTTLLLHCQLQPRAANDEIVGIQGDRLKIRITAPPVDGKANQHLVALMAKWFGVAKSRVSIVRGGSGRQKTLTIDAPQKIPRESAVGDAN